MRCGPGSPGSCVMPMMLVHTVSRCVQLRFHLCSPAPPPSLSSSPCAFTAPSLGKVRDVNAHTDNGTITGSWDVKLPPRGSQFVVFAL